MTSHPPPYTKFHNPDEDPYGAGQAPVGYPGYPGTPINLNQTVNTPPASNQTVVVTQPAATNAVVVQAPTRPASYMWLSCLVFWLCNPLFGGIAFCLSIASSSAADDNRMGEARSCGKAALWTSVIGLVLGVVCISVFIGVYATVWNKVDSNLNDQYDRQFDEGIKEMQDEMRDSQKQFDQTMKDLNDHMNNREDLNDQLNNRDTKWEDEMKKTLKTLDWDNNNNSG